MKRSGIYFLLVLVLVPSGLILSQLLNAPLESEPVVSPLQTNFTLGILVDRTTSIPNVEVITRYAEAKITQYCNQSDLPYSFSFDVKTAEGQASKALEQVQVWDEEGVHLVVGPPWSSMFCVCRSYANDNGMLMFSQESTSPLLTVDDNGFRLAVSDFKEVQILVELLKSRGIDSIFIIQGGNAWADGLANEIDRLFEGEIELLRYASETTDFTGHMNLALQKLSKLSGENKAVVGLSFDELTQVMNATTGYPELTSVPWFCMGQKVNSTTLNEVRNILALVNMTGFYPTIPESSEYDELNALYMVQAFEPLGFYTANIYDICWLYALSVIETGSDDATEIKQVLPSIASSYKGLTGDCSLDRYGDRNAALYQVYRYENTANGVHAVKRGEMSIVFADASLASGVH